MPEGLAPSMDLRYVAFYMTTPQDDFYLKVAHALEGCQLVEQELKLYITEALELAKECIGNKLPFKMSGENYADSSLERLIDIFKKLSDDEDLVKELDDFRKERNMLSHRGITNCLNPDGEVVFDDMPEFRDRLAAIAPEAQRLRYAIFQKSAVLGFDNLTDAG